MRVHILDTDKEKLEILYKMREQKLDQTLIYSLDFCTDKKWLEMLKNAWCLTVKIDGKPAGIAFFDNHNGKSAFSHFLLTKECFPMAKDYGQIIISWLEEKLGIRTLLGLTPRPYKHAHDLVKQWGFKPLTIMKESCYFAKFKKYTDGTLYMRES